MNVIRRIFNEEIQLFFACPAVLWELIFLYLPAGLLIVYSVLDYDYALDKIFFTFDYYRQILNTLYFRVILNSFILAFLTALFCFLIAYPVAYYIAFKVRKRLRMFFLFLIIIPSWTSLIVQVYAWFFLLEKNGPLSRFLYSIGVISGSCHLLNNYFSTLVGMVSCFLPFMIMPIYVVLEKMGKQLLEVSEDLGASRFETFKRIVFPLSLPGVYAGFLLVFIPAFGEFAIPTLLGGAKQMFWGSLIVNKFLRSRDWRLGAALAIVGILLPVFIFWSGYIIRRVIASTRLKNGKNGPDYYRDYWSYTETLREED